jgi:hypothetical protein
MEQVNLFDAGKPALPTNLEEAVAYLLPRFSEMEAIVKKYDQDGFVCYCESHLNGGIGMQIRNELQLWVLSSPLHQWFRANHHLTHPDDMSRVIIGRIYQVLKPKEETDQQANN